MCHRVPWFRRGHDSEKWIPVFRKDHAQSKTSVCLREGGVMADQLDAIDRSAKPAEPAVKARNSEVYGRLPFSDRQDFEDADRGFITTLPDATVTDASGRAVWSQKDYDFLKVERAPDTVNPSLWRQAQLNCRHGLYEV